MSKEHTPTYKNDPRLIPLDPYQERKFLVIFKAMDLIMSGEIQ